MNVARLGAQVVAPYRGEEKYINHLKVMGELGQIVPVAYSIRDKNSVERAVMRSDVVINLLGSWWDTRNFTMEEANVTAARTIAEVCSKRGISRFIQASALHADEDSPSRFARVKVLSFLFKNALTTVLCLNYDLFLFLFLEKKGTSRKSS